MVLEFYGRSYWWLTIIEGLGRVGGDINCPFYFRYMSIVSQKCRNFTHCMAINVTLVIMHDFPKKLFPRPSEVHLPSSSDCGRFLS